MLDPDYAEAHRWLAFNLWFGWAFWNEPREPNRARAMAEAQRAVALDPNDAGNRWVLGIILGHERRWPESDAEFDATFKLDPNHADAWAMRSDLLTLNGQSDRGHRTRTAGASAQSAPARLVLLDAGAGAICRFAITRLLSRRYAGPKPIARHRAARLQRAWRSIGRLEDARQEGRLFMISNPHFTIRQWADSQPFRDEETRAAFRRRLSQGRAARMIVGWLGTKRRTHGTQTDYWQLMPVPV